MSGITIEVGEVGEVQARVSHRGSGSLVDRLRAMFELSKPRITLLEVTMTAGGLALAPGTVGWSVVICVLVGTALSVASANALNMWWERDIDGKMLRTQARPLPSGRLPAGAALAAGVALGIVSTLMLALWVNVLTAVLSVIALLSYVVIYTPLKRRTPHALVIGAVPGAMPALMGWTAVTGALDVLGVVFFGLLFVWQLPHFIAIAIFNQEDYARADMKVLPLVRSERSVSLQAFGYTVLLVIVSVLLYALGGAGLIYLGTALVLGGWFVYVSFQGMREGVSNAWARKLFFVSLVYLPLMALGLMLDVAIL